MCGIVGVVSLVSEGLTRDNTNILKDLTFVDTVRGEDSTGVFFHKYDKATKHELWVSKDTVPGYEFLGSRAEWYDMLGQSKFAVVHNRAATIGKVTKELAHPFTEGAVTGVHNGTVRVWEHLTKNIPDVEGMMDSHAIIAALAHADPDPDEVSSILRRIDTGAYSLVWYDKRIGSLRFARNHDRPMNMVQTYRNLWIGSELEMLEWALSRGRVTMQDSWSVKPYMLVDIPMQDNAEATAHDYKPRVSYNVNHHNSYAYANQSIYLGDDDDDPLDLPYRGGASWWDKTFRNDTPVTKRSAWDEWREAQEREGKIVDRRERAPGVAKGLSSVVVTQRSTLPVSIPTECCQTIYNEMKDLLGLNVWHAGSPSLRHILNEFLEDQCGESVHDVKQDATLVSVHVVDVDDDGMYGYIELDDKNVAAAFSLVTADLKERVKEVLATGVEAIVYNCEVDAIKVYHHGDLALRVGKVHADAHTVWSGVLPIDQDSDASQFNEFAFGHPDKVCQLAGVDWRAGWLSTKD